MGISRRKRMITLSLIVLVFGIWVWMKWRPAQRFAYSPPANNEFRVVTWNVGYFAPVKDKNLRDTDLESITRIVKGVTPDVVVLQEIRDLHQAKEIADTLGDKWSQYAEKTGHGNQVIAILSPYAFTKKEAFECGGRTTIGASLLARNGDSVYILGVHSPHPARGVQDNVDNIRCALSHADDQKEKIRIITGDMNYNIDPQERENKLYKEILEKYGDGTIRLGETYYAHTRIDHMFHYPKDLEVILENSGIIDLPLRLAKVPGARDHRPIVVSYKLSP